VISRHLQNVFKSHELQRSATVAENATVQLEGGREVVREIEYYNPDAILSVTNASALCCFWNNLRRNLLLLRKDGQPRLADNAMVALALLVAESDPKHKELMIRLTLNLMEEACSQPARAPGECQSGGES